MKNKFLKFSVLIVLLSSTISCKKYLNINSDPDTTQNPSNSSVFIAMLASIHRGVQYDSRYLGKYTQNWLSSANGNADTWDRMGYIPASDVSGDIWRQTYFGMGANLDYIIKNGIDKGQLEYTGAAMALKALMFQACTDYHGDIIYSEAFKENTYYFHYDTQDMVYLGVDSLCRLSLSYFDQAIAKGGSTLAVGDISYNGDLTKWKKLVYALLAKNFHRYANKANYSADSVIKYCDLAMTSVADDFVVPFDASKNDDANFYGPYRNNIGSFRQSNFIVKLLDGTTLAGTSVAANRDPRMAHMLAASQDTTNGNGGYRGVDPGIGDPFSAVTTGVNARKRVAVPWGDSLYANPSASVFTLSAGKYLFRDKAALPVICYPEIQFIKAEAAFKKGDKVTAYNAYLAGINGHFDFINKTTWPRGNMALYNTTPISATQRTTYLASANVRTQATLTISDIMLQKYIALWGWGWVETWVDLRRYHYNVDLDPTTTLPVYKNFLIPTSLFTNNNGKVVQRVRPRYNSEYVWNMEELKRIGADKADYHTVECWFSKP